MGSETAEDVVAASGRHYCLIGLGGTIASAESGDGSPPGAVPTLSADALGDSVRPALRGADLTTVSFRQSASGDLTFADIVELAELVEKTRHGGSSGVLITQGTDTLAEVAFMLSLLVVDPGPVVVTGAMRPATALGADGQANLAGAIRALDSGTFADAHCVVVMNDQIFDPWLVYKSHTSAVDSFQSRLGGSIGQVSEGDVHRTGRIWECEQVRLPHDPTFPVVPIIPITFSADRAAFERALSVDHPCIVLDAIGGGHVPSGFMPAIKHALKQYPVIFSSRCPQGATLEQTYGFLGSERDLRSVGALPSGILDTNKARVLATLLLASGRSRGNFEETFRAYVTHARTRR